MNDINERTTGLLKFKKANFSQRNLKDLILQSPFHNFLSIPFGTAHNQLLVALEREMAGGGGVAVPKTKGKVGETERWQGIRGHLISLGGNGKARRRE